jgi:aspartate aminotransferase-like enzyme
LTLEWGEPFTKEQLADELKANPGIKAVLATLSETSSGTVYDIQGYGEILAQSDAILIVDGISGLAATPCPVDEWKVDIMVSGSQKSFMIPPGLAYLSFSTKAWDLVEKSTLPSFYFDARKYKKSLEKRTTPYTPAISLIIQQKKSLDIIKSLGLEKLFEHHQILADATRAGIKALGLELLSKMPGNILTAVKVPGMIDGIKLVKTMQGKYMAYIAGGQDPYKGKMFRIAHLGYMGGFDIIIALTALEMTLSELGLDFKRGSAIEAAETILQENWE